MNNSNFFLINSEKLIQLAIAFIVRFLFAVIILVVGFWLTKRIHKLISKGLKKTNLDSTVISFISNLSYAGLISIFILMSLAQVGIRTTSIVAVLGASALAIGLALQGSLSNFASGILLVVFRYFKVDDLIEVAGVKGYVEAIQIFTTTLRTLDNYLVIIPNAKLIEDNIINYYAKPQRRIDLVIGISYGDDIDKARRLLTEILEEESRVLSDPPAVIWVGELGDNSVNLYVYPWVNSPDYLPVKYTLIETIKKKFDLEGITIPFPQRDVYLHH